MPPSPLAGLETRLRPADPRPDADLLDRFTATGDEAAFAELVRRYGGLVWAVCRRLTPARHAAEDAFQATFLVLVRRAGAVRRRASVAGFLHGVARKVVARCRHRAAELPVEVADESADPLACAIRREEAATLHAELDRLPGRYREVLLLCDLGGLSRDDAAARLGWTEGSVKGRLERGRTLLAVRLAKRVLAGGLTAAAVTVPTELAAGVGRSAVAVWLGGPLPAGLTTLVRAATPWAAGKLTAGGLLAVGLGVSLTAFAGPADPPPTPPAAKPVATKPADMAAVLAAAREAEAAVAAATGDDIARNRLFCDLAELYRRAGDPKKSAAALGKAKAVTDGMDDFRFHEWRRIAQGYARLGDADIPLELAAAVPADNRAKYWDVIRQEAADAAARASHTDAAAKLFAAITDRETRDWMAAEARVAAVVRRAAGEQADGAVAAALALADPAERVQALVGVEFSNLFPVELDASRWIFCPSVAGARLKAGDRTGAAEAVTRAAALLPAIAADGPVNRRTAATAAVVSAAARLGDLATCRTLDDALPSDRPLPEQTHGWKVKVTGYRAAAEARAGHDTVALKLADAFPTDAERHHVLLAVATGQHAAGRADAAGATFDRLMAAKKADPTPDYYNLVHALGIARDRTRLKAVLADWLEKEARQRHGDQSPTADQFAYAAAQSGHPAIVAGWLAEAGDFAGAIEAAKAYQLDEPSLKVRTHPNFASVLKVVAERRTAAGQADAVRKEAAAEADPLFRAHRLTGLAEGLLGREW